MAIISFKCPPSFKKFLDSVKIEFEKKVVKNSKWAKSGEYGECKIYFRFNSFGLHSVCWVTAKR